MGAMQTAAVDLQRVVPLMQIAIEAFRCKMQGASGLRSVQVPVTLSSSRTLSIGNLSDASGSFSNLDVLEPPRKIQRTSSSIDVGWQFWCWTDLPQAEPGPVFGVAAMRQVGERRILGRQELMSLLPVSIGSKRHIRHPISNNEVWRHISQDHMEMEVHPVPSGPDSVTSLDTLTLSLPRVDDETLSLPSGVDDTSSSVAPVAVTVQLPAKRTIHICKAGALSWTLVPPGGSAVLQEGDRLAIFLLTKRDLAWQFCETDAIPFSEAVCVLGINFQRPVV